MSYARWGWHGSDVYVFGTRVGDEEQFCCCGCRLAPKEENFDAWTPPTDEELAGLEPFEKLRRMWPPGHESWYTPSRAAMIEHLEMHREIDQKVPQHAIDRLAEESEWGVA